jgi:hypothetical protein
MLLEYALLTAPTPLQAGSSATLTLTISNGSRQNVTVTNIVIAVPVGTNAKDLTASTGFQTDKISGWNVAQSGGVLTLTPASGTGPIGANAVVVTIANVAINDQPGTTNISISETAAVGGGSPATNSTTLPAAKFPPQFAVSDLTVMSTHVPFGGSVSVNWTGAQAEGATYTLDWADAPTHPVKVSNIGPHQANNLTIFPVVFTLTVSLTVPGQDQPMIVQKQAVVEETPQVAITQFLGSQTVMAGADPPLTLQWQVQLANSVTLGLQGFPGSVDVNGLSGCTVTANGTVPFVLFDPSGKQVGTLTPPNPIPEFLTFVLTASGGNLVAQQRFQIQILAPAVTEFTWRQHGGPEGPRTYTLYWSTVNANPVMIDHVGTVGPSGQFNTLSGGIYTLTAMGFGATAHSSKSVPGPFRPPPGQGCVSSNL